MIRLRILLLSCYFLLSGLKVTLHAQDTTGQERFDALKRATEAVFEIKKDSFAYHKDYVTQEEGRAVKIYSMVWIGKLFNPYDNHALLAWSLNDTVLHVEIRHKIGQVWVRRFQYESNVSKAWDKLPEPVLMMTGEKKENMLFIASPGGQSVYKGVNGDKWIYVKGNFRKLNEKQ